VDPTDYLDVTNSTAADIPDAGNSSDWWLDSTIETTAPFGEIVDLDLDLAIDHTRVGDLFITLTHVDTGTSVIVLDQPGIPATLYLYGCEYDDVDARFDDASATPAEDECNASAPAIGGTVSPAEPLAVFNGESTSGEWRLRIVDNGFTELGTLNSWTLHFGVVECHGHPATIVGSSGPDLINGTGGADVIVGLGGDDTIDGGGGADVICGGPGADVLYGGIGNDRLYGEGGNDRLVPGPGTDSVQGGPKADIVDYSTSAGPVSVDLAAGTATGQGTDSIGSVKDVIGSDFDDVISGTGKGNRLEGGGGADTLSGRGGNDKLYGGGGNDTLLGGSGNDYLSGDGGSDSADGGPGSDTCSAESVTSC